MPVVVLRDVLGRLVYTAPAAADGSAALPLPAGVYLLQNDQQMLRVTME